MRCSLSTPRKSEESGERKSAIFGMSSVARATKGALLSGIITALTIGIVLTPILAVISSFADASLQIKGSWIVWSIYGFLVSLVVGLLPGAIVGARRSGLIEAALIGAVWATIAGAFLLGVPFGVQGFTCILVGLAVSPPGAALGMGVAWQLNRTPAN